MSRKSLEYIILFFLFSYSLYCSFIVGSTWDEFYHYKNGENIFKYIFSLGQREYESSRFIFHYGLYDFLSTFFSKNFPKKYLVESHHLFNLIFSTLTVFGIYQITKKLFNYKIAKICFLICFLNPIFFGHFSINPKDTIFAFSYIWILCISLKYFENINNLKKKNNYLIYLILLFSLGLGIRLTFVVALFPVFVVLIFELFKYKNILLNSKKFIIDLIIVFISSLIITILFWPDTHSNLIIDSIIHIKIYFNNFMNSTFGLPLSVLNGEFYSTANTPWYYIFVFLFFKMPIYAVISFLFFPIIIFDKKFTKNFVPTRSFIYIFINIVFLLTLILILDPGITDGIRYFLYIIPFFLILSSLTIFYIYLSSFKLLKYLLVFLFVFNLFIFFKLTPYHYIFVNNFNGKFSNNLNRFENDYWGTSLKELIYKAEKNKVFSNYKSYRLATCGLNPQIVKFYLNKYTKHDFKFVSTDEKYDLIIFINRVDNTNFNLDEANTCYNKFFKDDISSVKRNNLQISFISK